MSTQVRCAQDLAHEAVLLTLQPYLLSRALQKDSLDSAADRCGTELQHASLQVSCTAMHPAANLSQGCVHCCVLVMKALMPHQKHLPCQGKSKDSKTIMLENHLIWGSHGCSWSQQPQLASLLSWLSWGSLSRHPYMQAFQPSSQENCPYGSLRSALLQ